MINLISTVFNFSISQENSGLIEKKVGVTNFELIYITPQFCNDGVGKNKNFSTPITMTLDKKDEKLNPESLVCVKKVNTKNNTVNYYLNLHATDSKLNEKSKGVFIQFEDKSNLSFPEEEIVVKANKKNGFYDYSSTILLDENSLNILESKRVLSFKLSEIKNNTISEKKSIRFMQLIKEIRNIK